MEIRKQVTATIEALVRTTGQLKGDIVCPQCGGAIPWYYNGDDLNFFCNTKACVFSSPAVREAVMEAEVQAKTDVNAPLVLTQRRAGIIMTKEHAQYKAHEVTSELQRQADADRREGSEEESQATDEWFPKTERERAELDRVALAGIFTGESKFGPVVEREIQGQFFEVRRIWYDGKKTRIWIDRKRYEQKPQLVRIHGAWPAVVYPDHLESTVNVGYVDQPM